MLAASVLSPSLLAAGCEAAALTGGRGGEVRVVVQLEVVELQRHLLAADLLPGQSQSQSLCRTTPRLGVQDHGCRRQEVVGGVRSNGGGGQ